MNVTAVASIDHNDQKSFQSNFGEWVDIAAPGLNILSTLPDDMYGEMSGTSMACPHVAGLAGLILSEYANRSLTQDEVKTIILYTADDVLYYEMNIGRRINAYKAMMYYTARAHVNRSSNWTNAKGTINITGSMWANNFQYYRVLIGSGKTPSSWTLLTNSTTPVNGTITSLNTTSYGEGLYKIRLEVVCDEGIVEDATWIVVNNEYNLLTVDDDSGKDYGLIQDAIDNAGTGDTVYVYSGTYIKGILIDRAINLTGDNKTTTIIDTSSQANDTIHGIIITRNGVNVSEFTIRNSSRSANSFGIRVLSNYNKIYDNIFTENEFGALRIEDSCNNTIYGNKFTKNRGGLGLRDAWNNSIACNVIERDRSYGIRLHLRSHNNSITENNIRNNSAEGLFIPITSSDNVIYHNSFINNNDGGEQAYDEGNNTWNNSYPSGGNYWDDYTGDDSYSGPNQDIPGGDGIGDTPYNISGGTNQDMYPVLDITPPEITKNNPGTVGFGFNVIITANVIDPKPSSGIKTVAVNITNPDNSTENFTMNNTWNNKYEYVFSDTWLVGQYNYTIWAVDNENNSNSSTGNSFNVSGQATISVCTIKDSYGDNETVNITDPPVYEQKIGYKLIDNNSVLHMWNEFNSYYFNTSSGIQITNYYDEYWSHNVLMLGYYNNHQWNLIYRTDELSGFNKNISTDNETFVNATLWKDLTYSGYDFRLAIRYHLGVNDPDLTVIPYIKNLGQTIPYTLAFGWEIKDIKIADTYENDSIRLYNGTDWISYSLNQTLDNKYTDMDYNTTFYLEGRNEGKYFRRTLYLRWNHTLDYLVQVKSRTGQYNAPVTLFIKVGTLGQNQEKYTMMNWLDSDAWLGVSGWNYHSSCGHTWPDNPWGALNGTGIWAHMTTENHWLVIDLNETYNIKKIRGRSNNPDDPTSVDIYISDDPDSWGPAVETGITTWQDTDNWAEVNITDTVGRYINISITSTEGMAGDDYLEFGKLPTPMTIFDVYGEEVSTATYYFNSYDNNNKAWATNPSYMVDGSTSNYASTTIGGDVEWCNGNTCSGTNLGTITKMELRVYGYYSGAQKDIILRPVFGGPLGSDYTYQTTSTAGWSQWFNITDDNSAPGDWDWTDVSNLDCEVRGESGIGIFTLYCSKVEMRVIYDPVPGFSDPYPANGSIGISISPTLNITVSDADGDTMNITWLSNSSDSWQVFGTNISVNNGTYHQTFSNASVNGQWWYWKVNVTDGTNYTVSSVYKFYTGCQSKIKNTGSTAIKGYLLIQVQCYNNLSVTWAVADDTINEASPRTIYWDGPDTPDQNILALDTIFNGLVNTSNLSSFGNGTYRIYAAFRDPDGNILKCDDETELVATYEFDITFD